MNITYEITEETYSSETNTRISYGITVYAGGNVNEASAIVATVHDITTDKQALAKLVALCNSLELSTIHLYEIIDDFLAG